MTMSGNPEQTEFVAICDFCGFRLKIIASHGFLEAKAVVKSEGWGAWKDDQVNRWFNKCPKCRAIEAKAAAGQGQEKRCPRCGQVKKLAPVWIAKAKMKMDLCDSCGQEAYDNGETI